VDWGAAQALLSRLCRGAMQAGARGPARAPQQPLPLVPPPIALDAAALLACSRAWEALLACLSPADAQGGAAAPAQAAGEAAGGGGAGATLPFPGALSLALDLCEGLLRLQQGVAAAEVLEEVKAGRATLEGPLEGGVCVLKALPL
jgi:hypothetical protein